MTRVIDLSDFWWDTANPAERNAHILENQLIPLAVFARERVPFYRDHYASLSVPDIEAIRSLEEFSEVLPYTTKEHLTFTPAKAFVPEGDPAEWVPNRGKYWRFGTGGTTGSPAMVQHSMADWRAMAESANRHITFDFLRDPHYAAYFGKVPEEVPPWTPLRGATIFGTYNADHITNNIYGTMLTLLGCDFLWRASTRAEAADNVEYMRSERASGILAPPEDSTGCQTKGLTLDAFLEYDARCGPRGGWSMDHRSNPDFRFVFWSSMPISESLMDHLLNDRRIPYVKGHFGSTEVCPAAATCSHHPRAFHLTHANSLVLARKLRGPGLADPEELGHLMVTKTAAVDAEGKCTLPSGTLLINFMTGDAGRLTRDGTRCPCGRNTSVLHDIQRFAFHEGKAAHGCQMD